MLTPWRSTRSESAEQLRGASEVRAKSCQVHLPLDVHLTVAAPAARRRLDDPNLTDEERARVVQQLASG